MSDFVEVIGQRIEGHISDLQNVLTSLRNGENIDQDLRNVRTNLSDTQDQLDNRTFEIS